MKKFGKKILALFMVLMCLATVGVVTANAKTNSYYVPYKNDSTFSGARYYEPNNQYSFHAHYYYKDSPKGYTSEVRNRWVLSS